MAVFQVNFMSQSLNRTVTANVILPTDKVYFEGMKRREEGKPYKTLYLLHGVIGNYTDWLYGTRIQRFAEENDLAIVMPAGENSSYVDHVWTGNMYGEFIGKELVEFTRKTFPLSNKKEDTYIGGLSMGGYGAIRNGLKYNDTFGCIIGLSSGLILNETILEKVEKPRFFVETEEFKHSCFGPDLSAALKSDMNPKVIVEKMIKEEKEFPQIYMACGDKDSLLSLSQDFTQFLKERNISFEFEIGPGSHEWNFWDKYIKKAIDWLPLESAESGVSSGNVGV